MCFLLWTITWRTQIFNRNARKLQKMKSEVTSNWNATELQEIKRQNQKGKYDGNYRRTCDETSKGNVGKAHTEIRLNLKWKCKKTTKINVPKHKKKATELQMKMRGNLSRKYEGNTQTNTIDPHTKITNGITNENATDFQRKMWRKLTMKCDRTTIENVVERQKEMRWNLKQKATEPQVKCERTSRGNAIEPQKEMRWNHKRKCDRTLTKI